MLACRLMEIVRELAVEEPSEGWETFTNQLASRVLVWTPTSCSELMKRKGRSPAAHLFCLSQSLHPECNKLVVGSQCSGGPKPDTHLPHFVSDSMRWRRS